MRPRTALWLAGGLIGGLITLACTPATDASLVPPSVAARPLDVDTQGLLAEAIAVYEQQRAERFLYAIDGFERFETMLEPGAIDYLVRHQDWDNLFFLGDEAFEAERDRASGVGQGPVPGDPELPAPVRRIHDGERGGLDATSCRACHFSGGPDGAGTLTQVGLFRGDGETLSSATVRDAPHVMGLGYLEATARYLEQHIEAYVDQYVATAAALDARDGYVGRLVVGGIDFGSILAFPDGTVDTSLVRGLSPDLKIRPFGHKGRHRSLVELSDEALQVHHGHQSELREERFGDAAETHLGDGPPGDRDDDGIHDELSRAQPLLLASYLAMLPVPIVKVPEAPDLALAWAEGYGHFEDIGCAGCHKPDLRLVSDALRLSAGGEPALEVPLSLLEVGQEPRPSRMDSLDPEPGLPLFGFTDLKRHDLGPGLADDRDEVLPDGAGTVPASQWLTRPLWGLADTAPYLHDGRAPTVHDAILAHGGEAAAARVAYLGLSEAERGALRLFLMSLTREPTLLVE